MSRLARASALQFGVRLVNTTVGAIATIYFVNELGVGTFGTYVLVMAVVNWLMMPSVGLRGSAMKRISEGPRQNQFYTAALIAQLLLCAVLAVPILLGTNSVEQYLGIKRPIFGVPVTWWLVAIFASLSTSQVFLASIRGEGRIEVSSMLEGVLGIVRAITQISLVFLGASLVALFSGEILAGLCILLVAPLFSRLGISMPSRQEFRALYDYGKYSWISNFKTMSYSWMDTIVLGFFFTQSAIIGSYEVAWRISALFVILPAAMGKTLFPEISSLSSENRYDAISEAVESSLSYATLLSIPGFVGAIVIGEGVINIYGIEETYVGMTHFLLVVLSFGRIAESVELLLLQVLNSLDMPKTTSKISLVFVATNVLLNVILIGTFGVVGAAVSTVTSITLGAILLYRALPSRMSISFGDREMLKQSLSAILMGLLLQAILVLRPVQGTFEVIGYVFVGAVIYFVSLVVVSPGSRDRLRSFAG